ncbi:hypothetical protein RhiirA4_325988, partial [Rhizophagus irregularis]
MFRKLFSENEGVKVNQKHLVDKILARYPTEFVVYRELIQNSDDAESSEVKIIFETEDSKEKIKKIIFKNNGKSFNHQDWERIKTIALGNSDGQKIGAFGVGFYSVFSVCDEPLIVSNGQGMQFFWNDDQLRIRYGEISDNKDPNWTNFELDLIKPEKFPDVENFARFLANSLGFMSNLLKITVYFNNTMIIYLSKELQEQNPIKIASEYVTYSPNEKFRLNSLNIRDIRMDVKRFVPKELTDSIDFKVANGILEVTVDEEYSKELKRFTKKEKLPDDTPIQMIFSVGDYNENIPLIFKDLFPYPEQGKIYIGFSTNQTTGCCSNLSALLVPSVERVSIDLINQILKEYNIGIIALAGLLCRIFYESEISKLEKYFKEMTDIIHINPKDNVKVENNYKHILRYFTFYESTPEESVSEIIEKQFFGCLERKLQILSTHGIHPIDEVRIPDSKMEGFIKTVPVVPTIIYEYCKPFFEKAKDKKLIRELSFQDVLIELKNRSANKTEMTETEMIGLLKWWVSYRKINTSSGQVEFEQFMQLATVYIGNEFRPLKTIRYILNSNLISPDVEIPDNVLPYNISKNFGNSEMESYCRWNELPLINWAEFIVNCTDLEDNHIFAEKVHKVLAKSLYNINEDFKNKLNHIFVNKKCIPTTQGMKEPKNAYIKNDNLPSDLPIIQFQDDSFDFQNLMIILGVNKVIKIDVIMHYINEGSFNNMKIAKYFGSILSNLKQNDLENLKTKEIWLADGQNNNEKQCYVASDLCAPLDSNRKLGLLTIKWTEKWDRNTNEAKFLTKLGLQDNPRLSEILRISALHNNIKIRKMALKYFIENFEKKYYFEYDANEINFAFLPCSNFDGIYAKPSECFINPDCAVMGFKVINEEYRNQAKKLDVLRHPGHEKLIERLTKYRPQTIDKAKKIFEYLETRMDEFTESELDTLVDCEFIPTRDNGYQSPRDCFFGSQGEMEGSKEINLSIDFGKRANKFLKKCGVQKKPSGMKIAKLLVESCKVWESIEKNVEKYKSILQRLADDFNIIESDPDLFTKLKESPILLGVSKGEEYKLDKAENIYVNDDEIYAEIYQNLLTVPKVLIRINFIQGLGCKSLSESIEEKAVVLLNTRETSKSQNYEKLLKEKARFFYINYLSDFSRFIRRDEEWLKQLKVVETDRIKIQYSLKNKDDSQTMFTNACISEYKEKGIFTLYITSKTDNRDISKNLVKYIYKLRKSKDVDDLIRVLTTSSDYLNENPKSNFKQENISKQNNNLNQDSTVDPQLEDLFKSLSAMFKDCDHEYIRQCLKQAEEDKLINVKNKLMEGDYPKR